MIKNALCFLSFLSPKVKISLGNKLGKYFHFLKKNQGPRLDFLCLNIFWSAFLIIWVKDTKKDQNFMFECTTWNYNLVLSCASRYQARLRNSEVMDGALYRIACCSITPGAPFAFGWVVWFINILITKLHISIYPQWGQESPNKANVKFCPADVFS